MTMDAPPKADLASRLANVFGALGSGNDIAPAWKLQQDVKPFETGKRDIDAYSSDEEEERAAPQALMPVKMMDSEDEDEGIPCGGPLVEADDSEDEEEQERRAAQRKMCSAHSRLAFEAEPEEDAFDSFAVSTLRMARSCGSTPAPLGSTDDRPSGATEVRDLKGCRRRC
jgi:hypothetical protein